MQVADDRAVVAPEVLRRHQHRLTYLQTQGKVSRILELVARIAAEIGHMPAHTQGSARTQHAAGIELPAMVGIIQVTVGGKIVVWNHQAILHPRLFYYQKALHQMTARRSSRHIVCPLRLMVKYDATLGRSPIFKGVLKFLTAWGIAREPELQSRVARENLNGFIPTGRSNIFAIRRPGYSIYPLSMFPVRIQTGTRSRIPHARCFVPTA